MPNHIHEVLVVDVVPDVPDVTGKTAKLGVIINQYKRACTINIRKIFPDFSWQTRFYDRIVRNDEELLRIEKYIKENPFKWMLDDLHTP